MSVSAWMPMYWGDYLRDTGHLSAAEHGAYLLLIAHYWVTAESLPDDARRLARIARMSDGEWADACSIVLAFFERVDGRFVHRRIDKEIVAASDKKTKNNQRASDAANARWNANRNATSNAASNAPSMPEAMLEQCPSPSPLEKKEPSYKEYDGGESASASLSDEEEFWQVLVPRLEAAGVARSMAGQVLKFTQEAKRSSQILRDVLKAKKPEAYLGGILKGLRLEASIQSTVVVPIKPKKGEPNPPPEWVQDVRALGSRVEWLEPGRWLDCDGDIVDDRRSVLSG